MKVAGIVETSCGRSQVNMCRMRALYLRWWLQFQQARPRKTLWQRIRSPESAMASREIAAS